MVAGELAQTGVGQRHFAGLDTTIRRIDQCGLRIVDARGPEVNMDRVCARAHAQRFSGCTPAPSQGLGQKEANLGLPLTTIDYSFWVNPVNLMNSVNLQVIETINSMKAIN